MKTTKEQVEKTTRRCLAITKMQRYNRPSEARSCKICRVVLRSTHSQASEGGSIRNHSHRTHTKVAKSHRIPQAGSFVRAKRKKTKSVLYKVLSCGTATAGLRGWMQPVASREASRDTTWSSGASP